MWELTVVLDEKPDVYMLYRFRNLELAMEFIITNENCNTDHCIYTIEKVD